MFVLGQFLAVLTNFILNVIDLPHMHYVLLWSDPNCSYTSEQTSFELTCNVSYGGHGKPDITCLPDSSDQVINIDDSQPGVLMYRKRVNITSNILRFNITCQASFNNSNLNGPEENMPDVSNIALSSIFLWNSEISLPCEYTLCQLIMFSQLFIANRRMALYLLSKPSTVLPNADRFAQQQ